MIERGADETTPTADRSRASKQGRRDFESHRHDASRGTRSLDQDRAHALRNPDNAGVAAGV